MIRDFFLLLLAVAVFELAARQPAGDCATSCRTAPWGALKLLIVSGRIARSRLDHAKTIGL
jgi:hypothetical protein